MRPGRAFGASRAGRGLIALVLGALVVLPGCGSKKEKTIPPTDGDRIIRLVQLADSEAAAGICGGASAKANEARGVAASLPSSVSGDLRRGLVDSITRLQQLIADQCQRPQTQTTQSQTQTTQTQTTQSQTTPTQTQTTPTETGTTTGTTPTTTTPTSTGTTPTGTSTGTGGVPPSGLAPPPSGGTGQ